SDSVWEERDLHVSSIPSVPSSIPLPSGFPYRSLLSVTLTGEVPETGYAHVWQELPSQTLSSKSTIISCPNLNSSIGSQETQLTASFTMRITGAALAVLLTTLLLCSVLLLLLVAGSSSIFGR